MRALPVVSSCAETECFYNRETACHAPAINVGDLHHPRCDTYAESTHHIARDGGGLVGACRVAECRHNAELMCTAPAISVGRHVDHPDCRTFELAA